MGVWDKHLDKVLIEVINWKELNKDMKNKTESTVKEDWKDTLKNIVARGRSESAPYQYTQLSDLIENELQEQKKSIIKKVEKSKFNLNIDEYLPLVRKWTSGYDEPYEEGYKQAKKDILNLLNQNK